MTKHAAKKIFTGAYEYRGWEIEKIEDHWNMKPKGEGFWCDAAATLSEAKDMIDGFVEAE